MTRIYLHDHKFHKILPSSFSEGEFERIITLQAPNLYPDYYVIPFKKIVVSAFGKRKPDLIFVAKDYRDFYVVEVEMAYHSFESHIEPQIHSLATARYDDADVIRYMCSQGVNLDQSKTAELVHNEPAKILLILNEFEQDWAAELKNKYGVVTSVFEVFHNSASGFEITTPHRAYGISHNYPVYSLSATTKCSMHPLFAYLGVDDNSRLQLKPGDEITLELDGCVTFWKGVEGPGPSLWLRMEGRDECINRKKNYQITKLRDDSLLLSIT